MVDFVEFNFLNFTLLLMSIKNFSVAFWSLLNLRYFGFNTKAMSRGISRARFHLLIWPLVFSDKPSINLFPYGNNPEDTQRLCNTQHNSIKLNNIQHFWMNAAKCFAAHFMLTIVMLSDVYSNYFEFCNT